MTSGHSALSVIQNFVAFVSHQPDKNPATGFTTAGFHDRHHTNGLTISPEIAGDVQPNDLRSEQHQSPARSAQADSEE
jgi:hypothetical protein